MDSSILIVSLIGPLGLAMTSWEQNAMHLGRLTCLYKEGK
jgi:hypothetical protein